MFSTKPPKRYSLFAGVVAAAKSGGLLRCCRLLGADPSECVYVGDSLGDGLAASAAGLRSVGVRWGAGKGLEAAFDEAGGARVFGGKAPNMAGCSLVVSFETGKKEGVFPGKKERPWALFVFLKCGSSLAAQVSPLERSKLICSNLGGQAECHHQCGGSFFEPPKWWAFLVACL